MKFLAGMLLIFLSACTVSRAHITYDEFQKTMPISPHAQKGKVVGEIRADHQGAIWGHCDVMAKQSMKALIDEARAVGADSIGEVRWLKESGFEGYSTARCKSRWWLFSFWPLVFSPLFKSATVYAKAYKAEGSP